MGLNSIPRKFHNAWKDLLFHSKRIEFFLLKPLLLAIYKSGDWTPDLVSDNQITKSFRGTAFIARLVPHSVSINPTFRRINVRFAGNNLPNNIQKVPATPFLQEESLWRNEDQEKMDSICDDYWWI
ncbi:hypothetical protein CDAR_531481 [Caerostris darwini]|uniref:Uncharacterized protein n=1 Tax=Caerostris darwini TaxID=1538125 RepID=A0AAV4QWA9_9ARAC|nr:hypothetical protein CDAR_531481 [Caerostris darwini]